MSKPLHKTTEESKKQVSSMVSFGIPQQDIADVMGIDKKTLYKYYRKELDTAAVLANTKVATMLYEKCMNGDTASIIFWMKTKMGWKETMVQESQMLDKDGNKTDNKVTVEFVHVKNSDS